MLSQFLGTAYGLSTSNLPLIVVDLVGLLCGGLTLAVTPYLRGSLIRSAKWNSRNTTSISQTPQPEESDGGRPPRSAPWARLERFGEPQPERISAVADRAGREIPESLVVVLGG